MSGWIQAAMQQNTKNNWVKNQIDMFYKLLYSDKLF